MPPDSAGAAAPRARSTRARPTLLIGLAVALLLARVASGIYETSHPAPPGGLVHWRSPDKVELMAMVQKKAVLYDFSAAWCEPCKKMEREVFADADAAELINASYLAVRVSDEDASPIAASLRERHGVDGLPTLVVVTPGAKTPLRLEGYRSKRHTLAFLTSSAAVRASAR